MNLNIQNVTPETVEIQGQSVNRAYAEGVMLTMLVATAGKNEPTIASIGRQYAEAGLSLEGSPAAYAAYIRADKAAAVPTFFFRFHAGARYGRQETMVGRP